MSLKRTNKPSLVAGPVRKKPFPVQYMMISIAAVINVTAGGLGLLMPESFPGLARPTVALPLIAIGIAFEVWAIRLLIAHNREDEAANDPARKSCGGKP